MKKKIIITIGTLLLLVGSWLLWSHRLQAGKCVPLSEEVVNPYRDAYLTAVIIPSENGTFGYNILMYGSILVHQPSRPGLPGNEGFATEADAMKVAELVISKIRNNEMPPTVTIGELRELGVL